MDFTILVKAKKATSDNYKLAQNELKNSYEKYLVFFFLFIVTQDINKGEFRSYSRIHQEDTS